MKPSIGRIVHYVSYGTPAGEYSSRCVAAIITDVRKTKQVSGTTGEELGEMEEVRLKIFNPDGDFNSPWITYYPDLSNEDGTPMGGHWHWPERVEE